MHPFVESLFRSLYFILSLVFVLILIRVNNQHRSYFFLRAVGASIVSIVVASLIRWGLVELNRLLGDYPVVSNAFNVIYFLICVTFAFLSLLFCFEIPKRKSLFLIAICCTIEHIARNVNAILKFSLPPQTFSFMYINYYVYMLSDLLFTIIFSFLLWFIVFRKNMSKYDYDDTLKDNRYIVISLVNIFVCVVVSSFTSFTIEGTANRFTVLIICPIYAILCCFVGLYLQINIMTSNKLKNEKRTLDLIIKRESQKNASFSENIEALQIEIHDLKKKLQRLEEAENDSIDKIPIIEDFNAIIDKYNNFVKTGNTVIDSILANKYLVAIKEEVDFTYFVDGKLLEFMDSDDVVSLFDNLLSNAFEAAINEEKENRVIHLQVKNEKQMVMIIVRNYSSQEPRFENGVPVTSKDQSYHGYGVKSIKRIVEKYGGEVNFSYRNKSFTSRIIIPNPQIEDNE